jgi:sterol desaturase/sphingolipid hydroxylase (fatty acid hydroxylase superfamily)
MFEQAWFLAYWGALAILAALEALFPHYLTQADRGRRWPTNFGFGIVNGLIASLAPALTVRSMQWGASHHIGFLNWVSVPWWPAFFMTLAIQSLALYGFHLYAHANPVLWRFHRVHHSDVHVDVTTNLRNHPVELVAMFFILVPVYVIAGLSPLAIAVYQIVANVFGLLTHANLRIPDTLERVLRLLFVTPPFHRVHHSAFQAETDSNYGDVFSFWDRVFGTYWSEPLNAGTPITVGLEPVDKELSGDFVVQLKSPWRA